MDRRFGWWLAVLVAAGLTLRVGYVFLLERAETAGGDAIYYHHQANALADGRGFIDHLRSLFWERPQAT
nr:hypothetical protein [Acidimicrobiia bacterium]